MFESKERPEQKDEKELTTSKKKLYVDLGLSNILREPDFAVICLRAAGLSEQSIQKLLKAAEIARKELGEKREQEHQKMKELTFWQKLLLKEMGLDFVACQQFRVAKTYFERAGVPDNEMKSLLDLNTVGINAEKKRIQEEVAKMRAE